MAGLRRRGAGSVPVWDTDGDEAERAGERAADGACVVPHPAASATISSPPHAVANDFFIELAS